MQTFASRGGEGNAPIFPFPFLVSLIHGHALRFYSNFLRTGWAHCFRSCQSCEPACLMTLCRARRKRTSFNVLSRSLLWQDQGNVKSAGHRNTLRHTEKRKKKKPNTKAWATEEWERGSWNRYVKREFWHSDFNFACGSENKGYRWQMGGHWSEARSLLWKERLWNTWDWRPLSYCGRKPWLGKKHQRPLKWRSRWSCLERTAWLETNRNKTGLWQVWSYYNCMDIS